MKTQTVDTELMSRLVRDLEARAHRRGWDQPPAFYVLYDATDEATEAAYLFLAEGFGPPIRSGNYAAQEAIPNIAFQPRPSHSLFRFALNFAYSGLPHPAIVASTFRQPGFLGVALQVETWSRRYDTKQERYRDTRQLADIPGSYESRAVYGHLVDGTDLAIERERGQKPVIPNGHRGFEGSLIESLRTIVAVIAEQPLPPAPTPPNGWIWPS